MWLRNNTDAKKALSELWLAPYDRTSLRLIVMPFACLMPKRQEQELTAKRAQIKGSL